MWRQWRSSGKTGGGGNIEWYMNWQDGHLPTLPQAICLQFFLNFPNTDISIDIRHRQRSFRDRKKKKTNCKWRLECIFKADTCQDQVEKFLLGIQDARIPGTAAPWPVTNVDGTRPIIPFVCLPSFFLTFEMRKVSVGQRVFNMIAASVCNLRFPNS